MKYRTKLYLAFTSIVLVSVVIALGIVFAEAREYLFKQLQNKLLSVASTTAASIDVEKLKTIKTRADQGTPAYLELQQFLRHIRNANRHGDFHVKFLYTMMPNPNNPKEMVFGVDAEENPADFSNVGDVDPHSDENGLLQHLNLRFAEKKVLKDKWGKWLTAYAPVFDDQGHYVATIGVDINAVDVFHALHRLLYFELPALGVTLLLASIAAAFMSKIAVASLNTIAKGVQEIGKGNLSYTIELKTNDEFNGVALAINQMVRGLREKERLKTGFARYVSGYILEQILNSDMPAKLEGERRKITVLFSDIRQFTSLAERLPPEKVVSILNEYFEGMLGAIFAHQGTLDKFIGDGLMAEFGAPLDDPNQERNAVCAALAMQEALQKLDQRWGQEGKPILQMGIGIHTGMAVVGNIGTTRRMDYTAIGDTVNVAARLEQATKILKVPIIISEATYKGLKGEFLAESLGPLALAGRHEEIVAFGIKEYPK